MEYIASVALVVTIVAPVLTTVRKRVARATPSRPYTPLVHTRD